MFRLLECVFNRFLTHNKWVLWRRFSMFLATTTTQMCACMCVKKRKKFFYSKARGSVCVVSLVIHICDSYVLMRLSEMQFQGRECMMKKSTKKKTFLSGNFDSTTNVINLMSSSLDHSSESKNTQHNTYTRKRWRYMRF